MHATSIGNRRAKKGRLNTRYKVKEVSLGAKLLKETSPYLHNVQLHLYYRVADDAAISMPNPGKPSLSDNFVGLNLFDYAQRKGAENIMRINSHLQDVESPIVGSLTFSLPLK